MIRNRHAAVFPLAFVLGPLIPIEAYCEVYMSDSQAAATIFPAAQLEKKSLKLSPEDVKEIEKSSGETVRWPEVSLFRGTHGETVYIDRVLGKHEFITYAVGVDSSGAVKGLEILEYRETYGHEIRRPAWRAQFTGKDLKAPLKLDDDIKNISGATLSTSHITHGVKRVLQTHAHIASRL